MALSTITLKQIFADARMLVKGVNTDFIEPTDKAMLTKYNISLAKIYRLLNGAKITRFLKHAPLGSPAAYVSAVVADNRTYTASTKVITAGTIGANLIGGLVLFSDGSNRYFAHITAVVVNTSFTVSDGPTGNIAAGSLRYIALQKPSGGSYSLDGYRIDELRRVHFPLIGNASIKNEHAFEGLSGNPNYDSDAAVLLTGTGSVNVVRTYEGSSATTSYPVAFFEEKPKVADDTSESCDLPEEYHGPLVEEIARLLLVDVGSKVPKSLENPLMTLQAQVDAFQMTKAAYAGSLDKS